MKAEENKIYGKPLASEMGLAANSVPGEMEAVLCCFR